METMAYRKPRPLGPTLTVPLERGAVTIAKSVFRGRAKLTFTRLELETDVVQLGDLIDALIARKQAMIEADTTADNAAMVAD